MSRRDAVNGAQVPAQAEAFIDLAWYEGLVIILILTGEALLFAGFSAICAAVQVLNLIIIAVISAVPSCERSQLISALALISIFSVLSFSLAHLSIIYSFVIVCVMCVPLLLIIPTTTLLLWVAFYGAMYVPITAIITHRRMSRRDLGLTGDLRLTYLIPLGILIGVILGLFEFAILGNSRLISTGSNSELIQLSLIMIFFVALVEELIFRVLLQPQLVERSSAVTGIVITSVLFGAVHAIYGNIYELLFTAGAGVIFGVAFYKTKNLPFVVTMHAVDDILLFGVLPLAALTLPH